MCSRINSVYGKCIGHGLQEGEGILVGTKRKHYFSSVCMCKPRLQAYHAGGQPGFCAVVPEYTNITTGTKIDCPRCKGIAHTLYWDLNYVADAQ